MRNPPFNAQPVVPKQPPISQHRGERPERRPDLVSADPRVMSQITQYPGYRLLEPRKDRGIVPSATSTSPRPGVGDQRASQSTQQPPYEQAHQAPDLTALQKTNEPGRQRSDGAFKFSAQASGFVPGIPWAGAAEPSAEERYAREPFVPLQSGSGERPLSMIEPCHYLDIDRELPLERRRRLREGARRILEKK